MGERRVYEASFYGCGYGEGGMRLRQITARVIGDSPEAAERVLRQEYRRVEELTLVREAKGPDHKGVDNGQTTARR